jgi:hypothetical protein
MIGMAWRTAPESDVVFVSGAAGLLLVSAGFLLTNPKE